MVPSYRLPLTTSVTPYSLVRTTLVSLLFLLGTASSVWAHSWSELTLAYETGEMDAALSATEAVQASFDAGEVLSLQEDAWALDWWRWFALAAQIDESQGEEALREALASADFPHAPGDAVAAWRDILEHLVAVSDARRVAAAPMPSDEIFEADPAGADAADLVRLSYLASLQGMSTGGVPGTLLVRFDALIDAARMQP